MLVTPAITTAKTSTDTQAQHPVKASDIAIASSQFLLHIAESFEL